MEKIVEIAGIRGIPAKHGGFETFAEYLSLYLVARGWEVTVYCQKNGDDGPIIEDEWQGVRRFTIPVKKEGAMGTIIFDWRSIQHLIKSNQSSLVLTLGYNTAAFCLSYRFKGIRNLINMDGIEWRREKWRFHERAWLWLNERCGCWFGNHLIADHPAIKNHLATRVSRNKITMIPYGAQEITDADIIKLNALGLSPGCFITVIARPEPENSILEIVRAFSRKPRSVMLVMLGHYQDSKPFHRAVCQAASNEVLFPGAIYDKDIVEALRFYSRLYIHGHRVGGTNPSLVEALGAGNAVLAHDNCFNRWVAGDDAHYFTDEDDCARELDRLLDDDNEINRMRAASRQRFQEAFTWDQVLGQYEKLLLDWLDR